ncbi:MAG TPA: NlpC/P60 family protein [Balneolaceae bacterium]|nr:NlpC/P60 family protein [Balneolaceae bacterium]
MTKHLQLTLIAAFVLLFAACSSSRTRQAEQIIRNTKDHWAPDSRTALFSIEAHPQNGKILLSGETNLPSAKQALLDSLSGIDAGVIDSIHVLPDKALGDSIYGLVNNSVSNFRSKPSHAAQLATQAILGMPLRVLKQKGEWYLVQTPDDYIAWTNIGGFRLMNKGEYDKWVAAPKIIYLETIGNAYREPSKNSLKTSDLVAGNVLALDNTLDNYYKVRYPDGRTGYVPRSEAMPFDQWKKSVELSRSNLVKTAKTMVGSPYLWGGTSTKGLDCSGFTKTIFFMNGWIIPRDASQQVSAGKPIDTSDGFDNLKPGDLLFFGHPATDSTSERVVHVGMWIGNNEYIHSSGNVHISSVDPKADNFDKVHLKQEHFLEARRYLGGKRGNIMNVAQMYDLH